MRRGCSIILLVLGGWFLSTIGIIGMFQDDEGVSPWMFVAVLAAFATPFLLVGAWISPGRRFAELGLTLIISAGVALFMVLAMIAVSLDEAFQRMMPEPLPPFDFTSPAMIVSLLMIGGSGYAMWRLGRRRE